MKRTAKDLTRGGITPTLLKLAWPVIIGMLIHSAFNIVDTIWVGRISAYAVAAVTFAFLIIFLMLNIGIGISIGTSALVAQKLGAKKEEQAAEVLKQSFIIAAIVTFIFTALSPLFIGPILNLLGTSPEVFPLADVYLRIIFLGLFSLFFMMVGSGAFQGAGDTKTPLKLVALSVGINIILDPIMIFGWFGFPAMGVAGAAIATVISRIIGLLAMFYLLFHRQVLFPINWSNFRPNLSIIKKIFGIGIPASLGGLVRNIGAMLILRLVAVFGSFAVASYGIVIRLFSIATMPAIGFSIAVLSFVGQNLGARKPERARKSVFVSIKFLAIFMGLFSIVLFIFPEYFIIAFNSEADVISIGTTMMRITVPFFIIFGAAIVLEGAFQGAGDAKRPMYSDIFGNSIIIVLGYLLAIYYALGINMIWVAFIIGFVSQTALLVFWYKRADWKKISKKVSREKAPVPMQ